MDIIIILLILIILLIFFYKTKQKTKENLDNNLDNYCVNINCGEYKEESGCLSCNNCGIIKNRKGVNLCVNGNNEGPLFVEDWKSWRYLDNPIIYNINSPTPKTYNEYEEYLRQLDLIYANNPQPVYIHNEFIFVKK